MLAQLSLGIEKPKRSLTQGVHCRSWQAVENSELAIFPRTLRKAQNKGNRRSSLFRIPNDAPSPFVSGFEPPLLFGAAYVMIAKFRGRERERVSARQGVD